MYLLPAIDILGGKAVRLAKGDYNQVTVYNDDPVAQARVFEQAGAQWVRGRPGRRAQRRPGEHRHR